MLTVPFSLFLLFLSVTNILQMVPFQPLLTTSNFPPPSEGVNRNSRDCGQVLHSGSCQQTGTDTSERAAGEGTELQFSAGAVPQTYTNNLPILNKTDHSLRAVTSAQQSQHPDTDSSLKLIFLIRLPTHFSGTFTAL